jgi:hypothetical protein
MTDIFEQIANKMDDLGITTEDDLEVVVGGSSVYEIDGAGTKWAPKKGTVKYNKDAFIVIRRTQQVTPSEPNNGNINS